MDGAKAVLGALLAVQALLAAGIDAKIRRLPNMLAATFAVTAGLRAFFAGGVGELARHAVCALVVCGALVAFELLWRRSHDGAAGIGMGDVKFLFGAMLANPLLAIVAFAVGLAALAIAGLVLRVPSLPALPFIVGALGALAMIG